MKKTLKRTGIVAGLVCLTVSIFVSCTNFFTNSWATGAKRDPSNMKLDASNVDDLLKAARGDTDMSMTILDKIAGQIDGASEEDKAKLREAALQAASQATNVAGLVVSNVDKLTQDTTDVQSLLDQIVGSADMDKMNRASEDLTKILPDVRPDGTFTEDFEATDAELTQAALIIILGKSGGDVEGYLNGWGGVKTLNSPGNDREEQVLAAIVNKLASNGGDLGNDLRGMLS
jgi:hypothetical protein